MANGEGKRVHLPPGSRGLPKGLRYDPMRREYLIDIWIEGRRLREYVGPSRRAADAILAKKRTDVAEGKHLEKRKVSRATFKELAEKYEKWAENHKRSFRTSVKPILKQLRSGFGDYHLTEITPSRIEGYLSHKREKAKPSTCNRHFALLSHMFTKAVDWGMWEGENPCRKIRKFREDNARMRFLTDKERGALLNACPEPLRTFVLAALDTGARKDELLTLQWNEVNLQNGTITILDAHSKSGTGRVIPLTRRLKKTLGKLPSRFQRKHVFTHPDGEPLREPKGGSSYIRRGFKEALKKANISDFRVHDLRHDFGSRLAAQGAHPKTIQELMGHRTFHMTMRYTHFSAAQKQTAISLLEAPSKKQTGSKTGTGKKKGVAAIATTP